MAFVSTVNATLLVNRLIYKAYCLTGYRELRKPERTSSGSFACFMDCAEGGISEKDF